MRREGDNTLHRHPIDSINKTIGDVIVSPLLVLSLLLLSRSIPRSEKDSAAGDFFHISTSCFFKKTQESVSIPSNEERKQYMPINNNLKVFSTVWRKAAP
jgi:hypothetical protein